MMLLYRRASACLLILCSLSIAGCLNLPASEIDAESDQIPPATGLLVGSVTQTSDGVPEPYHTVVGFILNPATDNNYSGFKSLRLKSAEIVRPIFEPNRSLADHGLEEANGKLFAVPVKPGTYKLECFYIDAPGYKYHCLEHPLVFEIKAMEILYLGNFDAAFCIRHAYANQYGVAGVALSINDESVRDIPMLKNKYRPIRNASIATRVLDNSSLQKQMGYLSQCCLSNRKCRLDL
jgi:hypothetical protein